MVLPWCAVGEGDLTCCWHVCLPGMSAVHHNSWPYLLVIHTESTRPDLLRAFRLKVYPILCLNPAAAILLVPDVIPL